MRRAASVTALRGCAHRRWTAPGAGGASRCELLSGDVTVSKGSLPGPAPTLAGQRVGPTAPKLITPPSPCPAPPPPGTAAGPAAGSFPNHAPTGHHDGAGLWPPYNRTHGDLAMRFRTCDVAPMAHPRAAQCAFWDKLDCELAGCHAGLVKQGECIVAKLRCTPRKI